MAQSVSPPTLNADQRHLALALLVVPLASFVTPFLGSGTNVALPSLGREFAMGTLLQGWFSTIYFVSAAALMLPMSRFGDIHGRRRLFLWGIGLLTLTCALLPLATSPALLILLRFLQGISGALIFATSNALMASLAPAGKRGRAIGLNATAIYVGMTCGPAGGGLLVQHFGWRSLYLLAGAIGALAWWLSARYIRGEWADARGERFDYASAAALALSISLFAMGAGSHGDLRWPLLLLASALAGWFLRRQRRLASPLLDLTLFTRNRRLSYAAASALLLYCGNFGVVFLLSLTLQDQRGFDAQTTGFVLLAQPAAQALFASVAGRLSDRFQVRALTVGGALLCTVAMCLQAAAAWQTALTPILVALFVNGLGFAFFVAPNTRAALDAVEARQFGVASGILQTMRLVGQMTSMAVALTFLALAAGKSGMLQGQDPALVSRAVTWAFLLFAACSLAAAACSWLRPDNESATGYEPAP